MDLETFLAALVANSGNRTSMLDAIWRPAVRKKPTARKPTMRMRSLPLEAAVQYGLLLPRTFVATDLTRHLSKLTGGGLIDEFVRHILLNLGGLRVVEAAQQMSRDGLAVSGDSLARYLTNQGFQVTEHNTAINSLRMWLAQAGVFPETGQIWNVDPTRKEALLGLDDDGIASLVALNEGQRAFLRALCQINPSGKYPASDIRNLAESTLGIRIARGSLPNAVLKPLKDAGLVDFETKGTGGGKTSLVWTTPAFKADVLEPFMANAVKSLDAALTAYYKRSPADIYAGLDSTNTLEKGKALEAYAIYIMRLMGLRFVGWRKRAQDTTGRAEIDVIMAGLRGGLPTLWQIQCKNTPAGQVNLEDVAKEVGLLPLTKATHVMVLANCRFTSGAILYSIEVMRHTAVTVFLLDRDDFGRIRANPGELGVILRTKSEESIALRRVPSMWGG